MLYGVVEVEGVASRVTLEIRLVDVGALEEPADVLVLSAFTRDYAPIPSTLVGALGAAGVDVAALSLHPEIDGREGIRAWVSGGAVAPRIERIVCVEAPHDDLPPSRLATLLRAVGDSLALVASRNLPRRTVYLALVGAGQQGLPPHAIARPLLETVRHLADTVVGLSRVVCFSTDEDALAQISLALDEFLERGPVHATGALADSVCSSMVATLARRSIPISEELREDLVAELSAQGRRSFTVIGVSARKLVETMLEGLIRAPTSKSLDLYAKIETLHGLGIAPWMVAYLHTIRTFGNVAAHSAQETKKTPEKPVDEDLALLLMCLQQVVRFWEATLE